MHVGSASCGRHLMFYFISKIVWFFLTPSNAIVLVTVVGLALMRTERARLGWRVAFGELMSLFVAGLSPLSNVLLLPLEERFPAFVDDGVPVSGIVVLGGTYETEVTNARGQIALNETGERLIALADLARRYPEARIVYSGGGSEFTPDMTPEATLVENTVARLGVARKRLIYERRSLNTQQNASYSKVLAQPVAGERWLLVTSAFHMPRSMGAFRAAGFEVTAYPVDYRTARPGSMLRPFAFVSEGLRRTDVAVKEWIGLAVYWLTGKTDTLFPAP